MKKLITLLLVLVSLSSYSQNDSIVKYYREITDDLWVKDCLDNWIKDTTKQWKWKHYNVESISTKELKEFYSSPSYKRKKEAIRLELVKRNAI